MSVSGRFPGLAWTGLNPVSASPWRWRILARGQLTGASILVDRTRSKQFFHTSQNRPYFCAFYWVTTFSSAKRVSGWPREQNLGGVTGELRTLGLRIEVHQEFIDFGYRVPRPRFRVYSVIFWKLGSVDYHLYSTVNWISAMALMYEYEKVVSTMSFDDLFFRFFAFQIFFFFRMFAGAYAYGESNILIRLIFIFTHCLPVCICYTYHCKWRFQRTTIDTPRFLLSFSFLSKLSKKWNRKKIIERYGWNLFFIS